MKRSLGIVVVMLLLLFGGTFALIPSVTAQERGIVITEEVLEGDRSAADGIAFRVGSTIGGNMIWDTVYEVGETPAVSTSFRFSGKEDRFLTEKTYALETDWTEDPFHLLEGIKHFEIGPTTNKEGSIAFSINALAYCYPKAVQAVIDETGVGESLTKEVRLADYYDCFPLGLWLDAAAEESVLIEGEVKGDLDGRESYDVSDFLKVPIPEEYKLEITVSRGDSGELERLQVKEKDAGNIHGCQFSGEDGCYFAFYETDQSGNYLPSNSGSGNGIYRVPVTRNEEGRKILWYNKVEKVCSLPEEACVVSLTQGESADELLLSVWCDGQWRLDCLDLGTARLSYGEPILASVVPNSFLKVTEVSGGRILVLRDGSFCMAVKREGHYQAEIVGKMDHYGFFPDSGGYAELRKYAAEYQEGKLYLLGLTGLSRISLYLYVYDESGLLYKGLYRHSGDLVTDSGVAYYDAWTGNRFGFVEE